MQTSYAGRGRDDHDSLTATMPLETDVYSRLLTVASLADREVAVLRAYAAFLRQIGHPHGDAEVAGALLRHPVAARALIENFEARFDPARQGGAADSDAEATSTTADAQGAGVAPAARLEAELQAITGDEDRRVFDLLRGMVVATLRTNVYCRDAAGHPPPAIAFKFDGRAVEGSPAPTPLYEIFVHSPRVEGVHLRGGKVARGGIRWSDRYADYRTEVHGLFKAQMVKNVVIVPEGAKGGFVVRRPPAGSAAAALRDEAVACYR
ncbi:MAG TPA: NAD-glutamate dehydrogenase domain-containing protein, partial [Rhodocyclaceae bacterium]|nr:NAD-glutamate dehydrogenase domain-containing protein [Rhodocyclaceae bacterium]